MIRPSTNHTASRPLIRPYIRHPSTCSPFDYHLLLMATFDFDSTDCKSKATKPDAKFNWKSFYFLVCLIGGLCVNTVSCALATSVSPSLGEISLSSVLNSKLNRSELAGSFDNQHNTGNVSVTTDLSQPDRTEYLYRVEHGTPADQQPNQTSTATSSTSSTYQIFNDQTSDRSSINLISLINRNSRQTPANQTSQTNQTSTTESNNHPNYNTVDELKKSCNEQNLCLPTNRTIRPSLITTYTAERQNGRAPLETPKNSSTQAKNSIDPLIQTASAQTQAESVTSLFGGVNSLPNSEITNHATEIESKMRRRFAADNSEQQKGLNEEDSKNYNQKKRDKMQKMQNYEQQVGAILVVDFNWRKANVHQR